MDALPVGCLSRRTLLRKSLPACHLEQVRCHSVVLCSNGLASRAPESSEHQALTRVLRPPEQMQGVP
jgi:hypothetical protein